MSTPVRTHSEESITTESPNRRIRIRLTIEQPKSSLSTTSADADDTASTDSPLDSAYAVDFSAARDEHHFESEDQRGASPRSCTRVDATIFSDLCAGELVPDLVIQLTHAGYIPASSTHRPWRLYTHDGTEISAELTPQTMGCESGDTLLLTSCGRHSYDFSVHTAEALARAKDEDTAARFLSAAISPALAVIIAAWAVFSAAFSLALSSASHSVSAETQLIIGALTFGFVSPSDLQAVFFFPWPLPASAAVACTTACLIKAYFPRVAMPDAGEGTRSLSRRNRTLTAESSLLWFGASLSLCMHLMRGDGVFSFFSSTLAGATSVKDRETQSGGNISLLTSDFVWSNIVFALALSAFISAVIATAVILAHTRAHLGRSRSAGVRLVVPIAIATGGMFLSLIFTLAFALEWNPLTTGCAAMGIGLIGHSLAGRVALHCAGLRPDSVPSTGTELEEVDLPIPVDRPARMWAVNQFHSGISAGCAATILAGAAACVSQSPSLWIWALILVVAVAEALRSRLQARKTPRVLARMTSLLCLAMVALESLALCSHWLSAAHRSGEAFPISALFAFLAAWIICCVLAVTSSLPTYRTHDPSHQRALEILESTLTAVALPLLGWVSGLFTLVRHLGEAEEIKFMRSTRPRAFRSVLSVTLRNRRNYQSNPGFLPRGIAPTRQSWLQLASSTLTVASISIFCPPLSCADPPHEPQHEPQPHSISAALSGDSCAVALAKSQTATPNSDSPEATTQHQSHSAAPETHPSDATENNESAESTTLSPDQSLPSLATARRLSTGAGVRVAIIDTGVNPHPDLPNLRGEGDLISDTNGLTDCDLHGSVVAGIIAGQGRILPRGVAPGSNLISIRQTSTFASEVRNSRDPHRSSSGTISGVARAITMAIDAGAGVVNISVAACMDPRLRPASLDQLQQALARAEDRGVVVIAAAGNVTGQCKESMVAYPAHEPSVISVGATSHDPHLSAEYSLVGGSIAAPGGPVVGPHPQGSVMVASADPEEIRSSPVARLAPTPRPFVGTSFAAPLVSGVAALIREVAPTISAAQVRQVLCESASPGAGAECGMVDPVAALDMARRLEEETHLGQRSPSGANGAGQGADDSLLLAASDSASPAHIHLRRHTAIVLGLLLTSSVAFGAMGVLCARRLRAHSAGSSRP